MQAFLFRVRLVELPDLLDIRLIIQTI